ncbi:MAG TPA: AzlD domain-containing protein [Spirochaetota bacterium]|nr:AzlD domain-containing protein [Spirochaetota bacterium]
MKNHLPLIVGMMLVTYIPRLLPLLAVPQRTLHPLLRRFLTYIPCTVLGALIMSGITQAEPGMTGATLGGIAAAVVCSWLRGGLVVSVMAAIAAGYGIIYFQ